MTMLCEDGESTTDIETPRYASSIDAALTLKSEKIDIELSSSIILIKGKAWTAVLDAGDAHQTGIWPKMWRGRNGAHAVCAAVLRTKAVSSPENSKRVTGALK
jgi:hypothetical protein